MKDKIKEKLKEIYDPEMPISVWDMGLIYDIQVNGNNAYILMTLTTPHCPMGEKIREDVKNGVEEVEGINKAEVEFTFEPQWTPEMIKKEEKDDNYSKCSSCGTSEKERALVHINYQGEKKLLCKECFDKEL